MNNCGFLFSMFRIQASLYSFLSVNDVWYKKCATKYILHVHIASHGLRTLNIHCGLGLDQIPLFHKFVNHAKIIAYIVLYDCF